MYELIILGLLMQMPVHGFLIVKIINDMIGPVAKVSNSRIYPLLSKLTTDGLVAVQEEKTSENGLPMKVYRITDAGRERFHELMLDVTSHARDYQEIFALKVTMLSYLPKAERLHLIDRYTDFCRTHINHFVAEISDYQERVRQSPHVPEVVQDVLEAMGHSQEQWELELKWALRLREREDARP